MPHRWCKSANLRRTQIESGLDLTFNEVFKPFFTAKISALEPGHVLEVGAGTGHLSKELSSLGFGVTAIEPSKGMHAVAEDVLSDSNVHLINCSSFDLDKSRRFDLVASHLVAQVVDDLSKFLVSVANHLSSEGHLMFSIPHPCFYNDYKNFFDSDFNYIEPRKKNVSFNITRDKNNKISDVPYHHRPLSQYINTLADIGFSVEGFDEIFPSPEVQRLYGAPWELHDIVHLAAKNSSK